MLAEHRGSTAKRVMCNTTKTAASAARHATAIEFESEEKIIRDNNINKQKPKRMQKNADATTNGLQRPSTTVHITRSPYISHATKV